MHPNAEVVRRAYEAFNAADVDTLTEAFDEKACWHTPGRSPTAGDREGRDDVFGQFARYGGDTRVTFRAALKTFLAADRGRVVGINDNSAQKQGRHLDTDCGIVYTLEDGRIIDGREHFFDLYNWDDFLS